MRATAEQDVGFLVAVEIAGSKGLPAATVGPGRHGKSDLFFRGGTHLAYWLMNGPSVIGSSYAGDGGAGWRVVAIDKFN